MSTDFHGTLASSALPAWFVAILRFFLIGSFPALLVLTNVRLVATETFLRLEYQRPGFPHDSYGFTLDDRLEYGPYGVRYMRENKPIEYLGALEYDGEPLFRQKELDHMADVQSVTLVAFRLHAILLILFVVIAAALSRRQSTRWILRQSLAGGGIFTVTMIVTLVVLIVASWDLFFEGFHTLFFEGDSWLFYHSDSLIRLYPEQFWFDAALAIGVMTVGGALAAIAGVWWWERHLGRQQASVQPIKNGAAVDPVSSQTED